MMDWIMNFAVSQVGDLMSGGFLSSLTDFIQVNGGSAGEPVPSGVPIIDAMNDAITITPLTSDHVIGLGDYLMDKGVGHANKMTRLARHLGAIFAVIVAGQQAYKVLAEQRGFDILEIMRPILFAFVLAFWGPIVNTVLAPGQAVESHCKSLYMVANVRVDSLRSLRLRKSINLANEIREKRASQKEQEKSEEKGGGGLKQWLSDLGDDVVNFVKDYAMTAIVTLETHIMDWIERFFIWVGEICYTVAIYIIFLLKALFVTVLSMFGPIYMAASILPAWKDAWKQWVERMVHVSLYGAMAYLTMAFSMNLITYCLEMDIQNLEGIVNQDGSVLAYMMGGLGTVCTHVIAYFAGCAAMKAVPEMASMVFPGGHSMAAGQFIGGMQSTAKSVSIGAVTKVATKGKG